MSTEPASQRAFRAACPNCGAPVDFRSAASPFAVCSFCHSTVVREGEALRKIGESAEVFDDHSPLQLGAAGTYQGARFVLVGRLQYQYADGTWNEWHALFETGRVETGEGEGGRGGNDQSFQKSGWLSEDNGRYVIGFDVPLDGAVPASTALNVGAPLSVNGQSWSVASVTAARLIAAAGELPKAPLLSRAFTVADVRSSRGEVGTLDYGDVQHPSWSVGTSVAISELAMTGLSEGGAEKTMKGKAFECPNCGAALTVKLDTTQSIVCPQCKSVIDVSKGVGADMAHYAQGNGMEPQLALGSVGTLALTRRGGVPTVLPWQVVGYVERIEIEAGEGGGDDGDGEAQTAWREYLLYNRTEGFAFLVDAEDGWSWSAPITGVPEKFGTSVKWSGVLYKKLYAYVGDVTYVLGEFYWRLSRLERTSNVDYQGTGGASASRLYREETVGAASEDPAVATRNRELVWSAGAAIPADTVLSAFRLGTERLAAFQRDAGVNAFSASTLGKVFLWVFVVIVVLALFRCGDSAGRDDCEQTRQSFGDASTEYQECLRNNRGGSGYRTGGGAFGGFSSGGSHK